MPNQGWLKALWKSLRNCKRTLSLIGNERIIAGGCPGLQEVLVVAAKLSSQFESLLAVDPQIMFGYKLRFRQSHSW